MKVLSSVQAFFTRKSTRNGANLGFVVFLVFGILVLLNVFGKEFSWRKDLTRASVNSLSPQTRKALENLKQDVKVYYFGQLDDKERNEPLLKSYQHENKKFQYEFVDTARRPTLTQTMGVKKNETVVLALGDTAKRVKVEGVTEEKVTNALLKLFRAGDQTVYFTAGHGERALAGNQPLSLTALKGELEKQGFVGKELNLVTDGSIPGDAAALVVMGPVQAFFPKELEIISGWLKAGGRLLVAVDLDPANDGLTKGSQQIAALLKDYGIEVHNQMLVDPTSKAAAVEPQVLLGFSASKEHPVTKDFAFSAAAVNFLFPLTTYLTLGKEQGLAELARTSPNAWAESSWPSLKSGMVKFDAGQDHQGQMTLAAAYEGGGARPTRIVAFATSTFVTNSLVDKVGNKDLFLNSLAWLGDQEQLISIRPRGEEESLKEFDNGVLNLVLVISVFLVPFLIVGAGLFVWLRRSKL